MRILYRYRHDPTSLLMHSVLLPTTHTVMFYPLFLIFLTTFTLTLSVITTATVRCSNSGVMHTTTAADCTVLIQHLQETDWFGRYIRYGNFEPEPGRTPKVVGHESCFFSLNYHLGQPRSPTQLIRVADYLWALEEIVRDCLPARTGYDHGSLKIGSRYLLVLGGRRLGSAGGINGTANEAQQISSA